MKTLGESTNTIALPRPGASPGRPLTECLAKRQTLREFSGRRLLPGALSDLLWAAFGVNRPESGKRTAPSAMNSQEVDIYVASAKGLYLYDARSNHLAKILSQDMRAATTSQAFATNAGVVLVFVADLQRFERARPERREYYAAFDAGCISQNVYLYCASTGLGTVVFDLDREALHKKMGLRESQTIIMAQAVGYPQAPGN